MKSKKIPMFGILPRQSPKPQNLNGEEPKEAQVIKVRIRILLDHEQGLKHTLVEPTWVVEFPQVGAVEEEPKQEEELNLLQEAKRIGEHTISLGWSLKKKRKRQKHMQSLFIQMALVLTRI